MARREPYKFRLKPDLLKSMKMLHKALRPELSFNMYIEMRLEEKMVEEQKKLVEMLEKQRSDPGYFDI